MLFLGLDLTDAESRTIEDIQAERRELVNFDQTIEGLVQSWRSLIEEIKHGYSMSIYDYTNDVSTRQLLEGLLGRCPIRVQQRLIEILQEPDGEFLQLTELPRLSEQCPNLPGLANDRWARIPKSPTGELLKDLQADSLRP